MSDTAKIAAIVGGLLVLLVIVSNWPEEEASPTPTPTAIPTPTRVPVPTVPSGPPPVPRIEGQPHGLGITNQMVVEALVPRGFAFEETFNSVVQRPEVRGRASLGPYFTVDAIGSPLGVIEFYISTRWPHEDQPPEEAILSVVDLATPNWPDASEWVSKQVDYLAKHDDVDRRISHGNYVIRVSSSTFLKDFASIQVSISPRFASCADALAAQDWTTEGSVGNERGYAHWRVPSESDPDGDRTVCESIP